MIIKNSLIILDKSTQFDDFEILSSNNVKVIAIDYETHQKLEPGVYIFVLQTDKKIKANKFTVVK